MTIRADSMRLATPVRLVSAACGVAALVTLAGCAAEPAATAAGTGSGSSASGSSGQSTSASSSASKNGTYTETGTYQTPGGPESITVTLTVKGGTVTAVRTTSTERTPNGKHYQEAFESGVASVVVGKKLATLEVGAVSGSSLTPKGFNAAVDKIRSDAA